MGEPKLLDLVKNMIRTKHYSIRTEEAYVGWIKRFILFHGKRHPKKLGKKESVHSLLIWPSTAMLLHRLKTRHSTRFCFYTAMSGASFRKFGLSGDAIFENES
jgi:hypothetical protein